MAHPKPTLDVTSDYPNRVGNAIDALDRRLKGNLLDNGAFQVWQRGTSIASAASVVFTADRWCFFRAGGVTGATVSRQTGSQAQYCARVQRDSGNASTAQIIYAQNVESINSIPYRSRPLAFQFRARMGANYSATAALLQYIVRTGTGTDQNSITAFTGQSDIASASITLTTSWQTFQIAAATAGASINQLAVMFLFTPTGTAGAADYFEIEEVQLVHGDYNGDFPYKTYEEELSNCRRYLPAFEHASAGTLTTGLARTTAIAYINVPFGAPARAAITGVTASLGSHFALHDGVTQTATTAVAFVSGTPYNCLLDVSVAAGLTQFRPYLFLLNNASARLLFTGAEL